MTSMRDLIKLRDRIDSSICRYQRIRIHDRHCPEPAAFSGFGEAREALVSLDGDLRLAQIKSERAAMRRHEEGCG